MFLVVMVVLVVLVLVLPVRTVVLVVMDSHCLHKTFNSTKTKINNYMQQETQTTIQIIGIVATVTATLGWLIRTVINHFIHRSIAKDKYIEDLVAQNQTNVENFVNTINHNQTKFNNSIDHLSRSIEAQTDVFKQLVKRK